MIAQSLAPHSYILVQWSGAVRNGSVRPKMNGTVKGMEQAQNKRSGTKRTSILPVLNRSFIKTPFDYRSITVPLRRTGI